MNEQVLSPILVTLLELNRLYYAATPAAYEASLLSAITELHQFFPCFTIAFAEIATYGEAREQHGGMRHVLMPVERNAA